MSTKATYKKDAKGNPVWETRPLCLVAPIRTYDECDEEGTRFKGIYVLFKGNKDQVNRLTRNISMFCKQIDRENNEDSKWKNH